MKHLKNLVSALILGMLFASPWAVAQFISGGPSSGGPPTGAAGGKLSGTYPNPGLNAVCGDLTNAAASCSVDATSATNITSGTLPNARLASIPNSSLASGVAAANLGFTPLSPTNNLSDLANAGTARTNLGLGSIATQAASSVAITGGSITGLGTPSAASDAAIKSYVDNVAAAINPAVAVQAATTASGNTSGLTYTHVAGIGDFFTGSVNTAITIDGYTFTALGQRLLIKNDTQSPSGAFNGVYYVTQVQTGILPPILTRAVDYDQSSDINNTGAIPVVNGTVNANTSWLLTSAVTTVGTDPLTYTQFSISPTSVMTIDTAQTVTALKTITNSDMALLGSSTGKTTFTSANAGASNFTLTIPAASTTIPVATQTLTYSGPTAARTVTYPDAAFTAAALDVADQTVSGGANVTSLSLGTKSSGTTTIDCGSRPLQYLTNGGAFTLAAPSSDGSCMVDSINNASAGTITFSGFTVGSSTGDALDTTNAHGFTISIWRINSVAGYRVAAHQ